VVGCKQMHEVESAHRTSGPSSVPSSVAVSPPTSSQGCGTSTECVSRVR